MAGFLYYVPGAGRGITRSDIVVAGLGHAFDRPPTPCEVLGNGPDGGRGVVLVDEARLGKGRLIGCYREEQVWRKVPGSPAWIGYYKNDPLPGPEDLARPADRFLRGHPVTLGDGREWVIPIAYGCSDTEPPFPYCALPQAISWDDDGKRILGDVLAVYSPLWDAALKFWDAKNTAKLTERRAYISVCIDEDVALVALGVNYRVGKAEALVLQLLNEQAEVRIWDAMIDWPTWLHKLKKNEEPATLNTADGQAADIPATDQPLPTSGL